MKLNAYLVFDGHCKEAFEFYEQLLGGKIEAMITHAGAPAEMQVAPEWVEKIMHARLTVGTSLLMGSDATPDRYHKPQGITVNIGIDDTAEAERIFHALAEKGIVQMPIQPTFWATRFGLATDRFGIPWMINCPQTGGSE